MAATPLERLRKLALALPEAHEAISHGEPTFWIRKRMFATFASPDNHHGNGRPGVWIKALPDNQRFMVAAEPDRFFVPPYVGPSGWIGVWLDRRVRWREVAGLLEDGYRLAAPKPRSTTRAQTRLGDQKG